MAKWRREVDVLNRLVKPGPEEASPISAPSRFWRSVHRAGWMDLRLSAEALVWLAAARLLVLSGAVPRVMRRLTSRAGRGATPIDPAKLRKIAWALTAVGKRVPWRCKCLERAIAGTMMLRSRGGPATLVLGIARSEPGGALDAHAWLRSGDRPVVGEEKEIAGYTVLARFGDGGESSGPR